MGTGKLSLTKKGFNMKKLVLVSMCCVMGAMSTANAGWFGDLFKKEAEPQTLSEACNTDEITAVCPEIVLGEQTLSGCLSENVKSLSKKCAKYVKKSVKENKDLVLDKKDDAANTASKQIQTVKDAVAEKKTQKEEIKQNFKTKKEAVKANAKAAGKELKAVANTVKTDAIETGKSVKEIVTE